MTPFCRVWDLEHWWNSRKFFMSYNLAASFLPPTPPSLESNLFAVHVCPQLSAPWKFSLSPDALPASFRGWLRCASRLSASELLPYPQLQACTWGRPWETRGMCLSPLTLPSPALSVLPRGLDGNNGSLLMGWCGVTVRLGLLGLRICHANPLTTLSFSRVWWLSPHPHPRQIPLSLLLHQWWKHHGSLLARKGSSLFEILVHFHFFAPLALWWY